MITDACEEGRLLVEQVEQIDSTNSELLRREPLLPVGSSARAILLVASHQTEGRGRRNRSWISTPGASLTASLAREVRHPSHLGALALVAGLAVAQALESFGATVRLKWPNDIYAYAGDAPGDSGNDAGCSAGAKAGGILCEARARGNLTRLVIGFGLNLLAPVSGPDTGVGQPIAGLFDPAALPDRHLLTQAVGLALLESTDRLLAEGFEPFRQAWTARDMLLSRPITIHGAGGTTDAVALGIDSDGAMLVEVAGVPDRVRRLLSEEVSVRLQ